MALADLEQGADALVLVFSGSRSARGFGIQMQTVDTLDATLKDVDLRYIGVRLDVGATADAAIGQLKALVGARNLSADTLDIDFGLDPLGVMAMGGEYDASQIVASTRMATELRDLGFKGPYLRSDGRPYHEAGAGEVQELAALIASGTAYLRALEAEGWPLEEARKAISFLAVADADEFMTIAKLRALRVLWARVEQACGLAPRPMALHAETAWRMLTRRDAHGNMLRNTIAVFSAGVGGADGVTVLPFTSALGLPDAFARRIARNTQTVLLEEANLWRVSDPAAGAGGFEALTDALCSEAWGLFQEIEREGGMFASLEGARIQSRIAKVRSERSEAIVAGHMPIIGTTRFPVADEEIPAVLARAANTADDPLPANVLPAYRLSQTSKPELFRELADEKRHTSL